MVYTVTLNPSLDYTIKLNCFEKGMVNRALAEKITCGGKGINVSIVLHHLGISNCAFGFAAGFVGEEIQKQLDQMGCNADFISLEKGNSRINVKIKGEEETEVNGIGPELKEKDLESLFQKLEQIEKDDFLVLAGSIPVSLPQNIYEKILTRLIDHQVNVVVDATGELLGNTLKYHPFLIKPNHHELGQFFSVCLKTQQEIMHYGKKMQAMGARNVLVSMAEHGAVLIGEDGNVYQCNAPKGKVQNSVGAGDSMVAGFLAGYFKQKQLEYAFKMGVAAGSASAFSQNLAKEEEILNLLEKVNSCLWQENKEE